MLSRFFRKLTAFFSNLFHNRSPEPESEDDIEVRLDYLRDLKIRWAAYMMLYITPRGSKIAGRIGEDTFTLYAFTHSPDWGDALRDLGYHNTEQQPESYQQWRDRRRQEHKKAGTEFPGWDHYETLWREKQREELLQKQADDLAQISEPAIKTGAGSLERAEQEWVRMLRGESLTLDLREDTTGFEGVSHD